MTFPSSLSWPVSRCDLCDTFFWPWNRGEVFARDGKRYHLKRCLPYAMAYTDERISIPLKPWETK